MQFVLILKTLLGELEEQEEREDRKQVQMERKNAFRIIGNVKIMHINIVN